jgi:hypothetical protein
VDFAFIYVLPVGKEKYLVYVLRVRFQNDFVAVLQVLCAGRSQGNGGYFLEIAVFG